MSQNFRLTPAHVMNVRDEKNPVNNTPSIQHIKTHTPWEVIEVDVMELPRTMNDQKICGDLY